MGERSQPPVSCHYWQRLVSPEVGSFPPRCIHMGLRRTAAAAMELVLLAWTLLAARASLALLQQAAARREVLWPTLKRPSQVLLPLLGQGRSCSSLGEAAPLLLRLLLLGQ
jgi:hypothetical protein